MRTILYSIIIASLLICVPISITVVRAGTDDSGLQVFTLNGADMLGESADVAQEDTKWSQVCTNMFNSGNGLCSVPQPFLVAGSSSNGWTQTINDMSALSYGGGVSLFMFARSGTDVYFHYNNTTRTKLLHGCSSVNDSDLYSFYAGDTTYVFVGAKYIELTYPDTSKTTKEITLPTASPKAATLWGNRFWISSGNYLFFTAAQDYDDFSNTATTGGTMRVYDCKTIYRIFGTKYGLYIFTDMGIFLMTGANKTSWVLDKISNYVIEYRTAATLYNDSVYFLCEPPNSRKLWITNGATITDVCELPIWIYTWLADFIKVCDAGRRIIIRPNSTGGGASGSQWIYDTVTKSFSRSSEYKILGDGNFYGQNLSSNSEFYIYELPVFQRIDSNSYFGLGTPVPLAWEYETAWITLDGNASNRKEIHRIEMDFQGGTFVVNLYAAIANTTSLIDQSPQMSGPINTRFTTYVWNVSHDSYGKSAITRFYLQMVPTVYTQTTNFVIKQIRIYYRNLGNYTTNSLR